jgi:hypothetical protein
MRMAFGLIGLLLVVLVIAKLGKTQLQTVPAALPAASSAASGGGTPRERIDAIGQQVQQTVDEAARRASEAQP